MIAEDNYLKRDKVACIYARVDLNEEIQVLKLETKKLQDYAIAKGYKVYKIHQEITSGYSDRRPLLNQALGDNKYNILVVESWDKLALNETEYIKIL